MKLAPVLHKFLKYCNPRKNITILRRRFFTHRPQEGPNFYNFVTELKKLISKYEFDNLQNSLIKDVIVYGTRDKSLGKRLLRSKGHAAEETRKYAREILRCQLTVDIDKIFKKELNKSSHNTRNQNTRDFIKKCKFCSSSHLRGKWSAYGKACHIFIKKNHFKVCCPRVGKKVHEIEKDESDEPSDQSNYEFFIETVNMQDSGHINQIKNENSDWSITLPSNGIPVLYKIDTGTQCNVFHLTILKNSGPEPDLCPVNLKLSAHSSS